MSRLDDRVRDWEHDRKRPFNTTMPDLDESLWDSFDRYLTKRGLGPRLAHFNGWYPSSNARDSIPRIVIPAMTSDSRNVFWQARSMTDEGPRYQSPFGPRGDAIVVVWGRLFDRMEQPTFVITEGPMDALAAGAIPYCNGIALMGGTPNEEALELVKKVSFGSKLILVSDTDSPEFIARLVPYFGARLLMTTPYKDLADMPKDERIRLLNG